MQDAPSALVTRVRAASRDLVRELGFLHQTIAGTDLSASAVHAVVEIGAAGRLSSGALSAKLLLEKSTVSRLVKSLVERGDIREVRSPADGRSKHLLLTHQGEKTLAAITRHAERQVAAAIAPLGRRPRRAVLTGLEAYAAALKASRTAGTVAAPDNQAIVKQGYSPSIIGRIVEMHGTYYSRAAGFGVTFEARVARDLAEFATRLDNRASAIWYAEIDGSIVGAIAIDGEDLGDRRAHLRWFIVDHGLRGIGLGTALIGSAIQFCDDHGFREIHLWTFKGLEAARRLYERNGFALAEEHLGDQWGTEVLEQKFVRLRAC